MSDDGVTDRAVSRHFGRSEGLARHGLSELGPDTVHRDEFEPAARNTCSGGPDGFSAPTHSRQQNWARSWGLDRPHDGQRGIATDRITSRVSPAQTLRTSFRHPQGRAFRDSVLGHAACCRVAPRLCDDAAETSALRISPRFGHAGIDAPIGRLLERIPT
jgi:hypothetical protein